MIPDIVTVGSMAVDSITTPAGEAPNCLGGAAVHGSIAASMFARVGLVGVVGTDYPQEGWDLLNARNIDISGVQQVSGETFFWKGSYSGDMGEAKSEVTRLNVFADFQPELPQDYRRAKYVFLANIHPSLQLSVLEQVEAPKLTMCDTMNFWISGTKDELTKVLGRVTVAFMNDAEIRQYTGENNVVKAARAVLDLGASAVVVKKGGNGAALYSRNGSSGLSFFSVPAYPMESLTDPTGAGDSFAGGFMGHLAKTDDISEANMRRAIVFGSVMASFNVQDFGVKRVARLTWPEVVERYRQFQGFTRFDDCDA